MKTHEPINQIEKSEPESKEAAFKRTKEALISQGRHPLSNKIRKHGYKITKLQKESVALKNQEEEFLLKIEGKPPVSIEFDVEGYELNTYKIGQQIKVLQIKQAKADLKWLNYLLKTETTISNF